MEAKFFLSKETLKTVNEFAFCLLIGQIGSSFFVEEMFRVSIIFFVRTLLIVLLQVKKTNNSNNETNFVWAKNERERQKVAIWLSKWVLIVIWYWLSTQSDCEWESSTTNFTRQLMRAKKQNWFFVVDLMTWDPTIMGISEKMRLRTRVWAQAPKPSSFAE